MSLLVFLVNLLLLSAIEGRQTLGLCGCLGSCVCEMGGSSSNLSGMLGDVCWFRVMLKC